VADHPTHVRIRADYGTTGGYMPHEVEALAEATKAAPAGPMLELGVFRGDSARALAKWVTAARPLFLYDNMMRPTADKSCWPTGPHIVHCTGLPALSRLGVLHEDADHVYATLLGHLRRYGSLVVPEGLICLHDWESSHFPDVKKAWEAWEGREKFDWVCRVSALAVFRRIR